jgi:ribonuclease P protein component
VKRRLRLRREDDFQRALKGRRVFVGQALVAFFGPSTEGRLRIGIAISRQLKGSVRRNRARRRLREAARLRLLADDSLDAGLGIPFDVVLIARPAALGLPTAAIESEVAVVRDRLQKSAAPQESAAPQAPGERR